MKLFIPDTSNLEDWRNQVEDDVVLLANELDLEISVLGVSENDEWLTFTSDNVTYNIHASVRNRSSIPGENNTYDIFLRIFNKAGDKLLYTYNVAKSKFHDIEDYVTMYKQALIGAGIIHSGSDNNSRYGINKPIEYNKTLNPIKSISEE